MSTEYVLCYNEVKTNVFSINKCNIYQLQNTSEIFKMTCFIFKTKLNSFTLFYTHFRKAALLWDNVYLWLPLPRRLILCNYLLSSLPEKGCFYRCTQIDKSVNLQCKFRNYYIFYTKQVGNKSMCIQCVTDWLFDLAPFLAHN